MKKSVSIILMFIWLAGTLFATPLTGPKSIPGDYATIAAAIADLNLNGVGSGGVTFNIAAGYTETFTTPSDGSITTLTGSSSSTILFQRYGNGANPIITAAPGVSTTLDAIITIAGCDYVTFDGINLLENVLNTTPTLQMEWGYAILKYTDANGTDGSQNVTIKNCTINLTKNYTSTVGIYSNNHTPASTTALTVNKADGANSNLKIYSNTINCYSAIRVHGFNDVTAPYLYFDQNNEIGKDGTNIITNVAGQATTAGYGIYTTYQNNLKVANNNITSSMSGTGVPYGIYMTTANNGSYELYNNYVSMQYSATGGSSNFNAIYCDMGGSGTNNTATIHDNTVTGCTYTTLTTGTASMLYLSNMGVTTTLYNNTVSNNTFGSGTAAATGRINYIYANKTGTNNGPLDFYNNIVTGNTRIQSAPGGGATYCIASAGKGTNLNMYNNTVTNNVIAGNSGTYLLQTSFDIGTRNVYDNIVMNITKAEGSVYGIYAYNATTPSGIGLYYRNKVMNIEGLTAGSNLSGIYNATSGGPTYYYNNFIADLRTPAGSTTSAPYNTINGFNVTNNTFCGFFNNTIFLSGTSSGTNFGSSAAYIHYSSVVDLRNNILVNNSTPKGLGKAVGLRIIGSTEVTNYSLLSNNNNYYAGTPDASHLIYQWYNNSSLVYTDIQTLTAFKARMYPRETMSVTELSPFVNTIPGSMDLHLQTTIATQCEAGGSIMSSPVSIPVDFDNDPRFPNAGYPVGATTPNAPDMGADEFGGISNDLIGPAILFTQLGNINHTDARTLTVSIQDNTGVPTSGTGLPMLYWKINSGSFNPAQGTWVSGSNYTFTFGNGASFGDIISYYIVAQDIAPAVNMSCYPSGGASGLAPNPPSCALPPSTLCSYTILSNISGNIHVGIGKTYTTLSAAITDINTKWINGPLTLFLDDATYPSELFPITINTNPGSSSTNVLTIKPDSNQVAQVTLSGTYGGGALIVLNGCDYVTIDGSKPMGGTDKSLKIENTGTVNNTAGISVANNEGNDAACNITIKNTLIYASLLPDPALTGYGILINNASGSVGGGFNDLVITNNTIIKAKYGIFLVAIPTNMNHNAVIMNNMIGSMAAGEAITNMGIYVTYSDNTLIANNEIIGPANGAAVTGQTGINLGSGALNTKIRNNIIHDMFFNIDSGWGASGIWCATGDASTVTEISNNLIYNIKSYGINPGVGQNIVYGIFIRNGGNFKILHNTIYLSGALLSTYYDASSACIGLYYQATGKNFEIRNNILKNSMTPNAGPLVYGKAYGIMISTGDPTSFTTINNNDYFIDGYNGSIAQQYANGLGIVAEYPTLILWQAFTGQEAQSQTIDPVFVSTTNLVPTNAALGKLGAYLPNVPKDIVGTLRTNPSDMGAYQFTGNHVISTLAASAVGADGATMNGNAEPFGNTVITGFEYGQTTSYGTSVSSTTVSGNNPQDFSTVVTGLTPNTLYNYRAIGTSGSVIVYGSNQKFTTPDLAFRTLNLKAYFEGFFSPGTGNMNKAQECIDGAITFDKFPGNTVDTLTILLANPTTPWEFVYKASGVTFNQDGTMTITLPLTYSGNYYIVIKQRSGVETWSAAPVSFAGATISYNFTTSASQAFANNQKSLGESAGYGIFSGDVTSITEVQDGYIDIFDNNSVFNQAQNGSFGYMAEDMTGDGFVDIFDMAIVFNNMQMSVGMITPPNPGKK